MKKRIFAILTLTLTLALFAFPVFADTGFGGDDDIFDREEPKRSFSGSVSDYSDVSIGSVTLDEGLYLFDCNFSFSFWGEDGEIFTATFFIKSSRASGSSILLSTPVSHGDYVFYVYVTSPISIYIRIASPLEYTVDIHNIKTYIDGFADGKTEGYNNGYSVGKSDGFYEGQIDGFALGRETGYKRGEADGYAKGETDGYNNGYSDGKRDGYVLGEADGWDNAIKDSDEVKTAIGGIFTGIFDGCVDSFNELTEGVTLMGLTLKQILLTIAALGIIGLCIWLFALKK